MYVKLDNAFVYMVCLDEARNDRHIEDVTLIVVSSTAEYSSA